MSAYAEDAYGKSGYFLVFLLYFLSLAIGNVAIAISSGGLPRIVLSVALIDTNCHLHRGDRAALVDNGCELRWTQLDGPHRLNNGLGSSYSGRASLSDWLVLVETCHIRGSLESDRAKFVGRYGFEHRADLVGLSRHGICRAKLGRSGESKRDVPLARSFGTLGAAVIYILSTTVIQGIVPNAELAASTGPFGLAYAKMFNPTVGSHHHGAGHHGLPRLADRAGSSRSHRPEKRRLTNACSPPFSPR